MYIKNESRVHFTDEVRKLDGRKNIDDVWWVNSIGDRRREISNIDEEIAKVKTDMQNAPIFKALYGTELEMSDDTLDIVVNPTDEDIYSSTYVIFDTETTGFNPGLHDSMIEIGAVKVINGEVTDHFSVFVNPQVPIPYEITQLTGINDEMVMEAEIIEKVLPEFVEFCEGAVLVAHNANFDMSFINENVRRQNIKVKYTYIDTLGLARVLLPGQAKHTLDAVCKTLKISLENHHRAVDDAQATAQMFLHFIQHL